MTKTAPISFARPEILDMGRIRLGAANRQPAAMPAVADAGRIRLGAANRRRSITG